MATPTVAQIAAGVRGTTRSTPATKTGQHVRTAASDAASQATDVATQWHLGVNWSPGQNTTGFSQGVAEGYDATSTQLNAKRKALAMSRASGYLIDKFSGHTITQMPLFVNAINIDTSLAGTTAQSQLVQDFYPRNFVQPVVNVYGWSLDQEDYGTLCEYVHNCQFNALNTPLRWAASMTQLVILGSNGYDNAATNTRNAAVGGRKSGRAVSSTHYDGGNTYDQSHVNQTIKGDHQTIVAKGFIESMPRIHQQFEYAVQWQFDFVVAQMVAGPFRESAMTATNLATNGIGMAQLMLQNVQSIGISTVSAAQNTASLAYAASHSATLTGTSPTGGSSSSSSNSSSNTGGGDSSGTPSGTSVPTNAWNPDSKPIANWIVPIITWAAKNGWSGTVSSGFRTHPEQLEAATAYVASIGTTIAAEYPDGVYASNHCTANYPGGAIDVTDASTLASVLGSYPNKPTLIWGETTIEDGVHFSATGH